MPITLSDFNDLNKIHTIKEFADQLDIYVSATDREHHVVLANKKIIKDVICLEKSNQNLSNTSEKIISQRPSLGELYTSLAELAEVLCVENTHVMEKVKSSTYISNIRHPDGNLHLLHGQKTPIIDASGDVIGVSSIFSKVKRNPLINFIYILNEANKRYKRTPHDQFSFLITETIEELKITPKQTECLFYLLRGKSQREIASILHRSPRTIECHIDALKIAFGCDTKSQLIEKALNCGYLSYIPQQILEQI